MHTLRLLALLALLAAVATPLKATDVASGPTDVRPLLLGSQLPDVTLKNIEGTPVRLSQVVDGKPALLVFYRGGWCPYCNLQLQGLRLVRAELAELGYQMIAISPDSPESMRATLDTSPLDYTLLSDSEANAIRAFGLAFKVDDATLDKYREYGIDLAQASGGQTHHALPVPAVYLVGADGTLQFSYVHPDYTVRMPESVILAAAKALHAEQQKLKLRR